VLAGAALVGVTVAYGWPLVAQMTTSIPGGPTDQDVATMVWNTGWVHQVLVTDGPLSRGLLRTNDVLVPFGADLRLHTYGLLEGLLAAPFIGWLGVVGAFNLVLLVTLALNGLATYGLVLRETRSPPAAMLAGACLLLASPVLAQMRVGRPSFAALWLVAAALLVSGNLLDDARAWKGVLLGGVLFAALLSDFQVAFFGAIWLTVYAGYRLRPRHLLSVAVAGLTAGVPFLVIFYPALARAEALGYPLPTVEDMLPHAFRVQDYVDPAVVPYAYGFDLLLGAALALAIYRRRGAYRVWLVGAAICLLLALGPTLQPTSVPLPFAMLGAWSPLARFRTPSRLTMPAVLGLAVVLGLAAAPLLRRLRPALAGGLVGVLVLGRLVFAQAHDPLTIQTYPEYATYARIAAEPGRFSLLEVPFGVRSGLARIGDGGEVLEYYQHVHTKPLLNGMIARLPNSVLDAYAARPSLRLLSGQDPEASQDEVSTDLADVLGWADVGYVLVHPTLLDAQRVDTIEALLDSQPGLRRLGLDQDLVVYAVERR
jgi:hypothetical protein